jgi:hypothetical protein
MIQRESLRLQCQFTHARIGGGFIRAATYAAAEKGRQSLALLSLFGRLLAMLIVHSQGLAYVLKDLPMYSWCQPRVIIILVCVSRGQTPPSSQGARPMGEILGRYWVRRGPRRIIIIIGEYLLHVSTFIHSFMLHRSPQQEWHCPPG